MHVTAFILGVLLLQGSPSAAQEETVVKAFDHYEAIRAALAGDEMKDIAKHAAALAPMAESISGTEAKKAAEGLRAATDITRAREHFGAISALLIPKFEKAALKDVHFFRCSMVNRSWAQRGKDVRNPYMGKAMLACGAPAKPSR